MSIVEKSRALMVRQHQQVKNRQQSMLMRTAQELGLPKNSSVLESHPREDRTHHSDDLWAQQRHYELGEPARWAGFPTCSRSVSLQEKRLAFALQPFGHPTAGVPEASPIRVARFLSLDFRVKA